jgi:hypothetical protein
VEPRCFKRTAHARPIEPPVVVAQDGHLRRAGPYAAQIPRRRFGVHESPPENAVDHEITQEDDGVGIEGVHRGCHLS